MASDHEIGRVIAVDTGEVTVELDQGLKVLTRSTYEGVLEIGQINSYVIIPIGSHRTVAMVTRVTLVLDEEEKSERGMVVLPSPRRLMYATMIGAIEMEGFHQGVSVFPVLDTPVCASTRKELDAIFGEVPRLYGTSSSSPGFCVSIGKSAVFSDYDIKIDPDAFFGKHAAVIGSTGSGKSCTIAAIIQSILDQPDVKQTRFVILDTNGEYRAAFQKKDDAGASVDSYKSFKTLYIPADPAQNGRLAIPYWFMNSDDFVRLFRASPGVQKPILLDALSRARDARGDVEDWVSVRRDILSECNRILGFCRSTDKSAPKTIRQLSDGMLQYLREPGLGQQRGALVQQYPVLTEQSLGRAFEAVLGVVREGIRNEGVDFESYAAIDVNKKMRIEAALNPLLNELSRLPADADAPSTVSTDCPRFFSKSEFRYQHLERAMSHDGENSGYPHELCSTMLMRIYRLLEDPRFSFLFGPASSEWPRIVHSLATFMRDILGAASCPDLEFTNEVACQAEQLPFYDRQRQSATCSSVVVIDLSLLASDVLENVTALIGRLILEFLQRLSDPCSGMGRGEYPVVLVLEEAQNYIHEPRRDEEESISKVVFERIAREGRKYGLGLVLASQRPSELSKTVLSQCSSFIVHRLQNPEDLRYFREIVPAIYGRLLEQLPALAPRSALVLGACVPAPALVEIREANPMPRSRNPEFWKSWTSEEKSPDFEAVCAKWEGELPLDQESTINEEPGTS